MPTIREVMLSDKGQMSESGKLSKELADRPGLRTGSGFVFQFATGIDV
jgi:hypothetical protein